MTVKVDFYCRDCKKDQNLPANKNSNRYGEWFVSRCNFCGRQVIRYITERHNDPYFRLSKSVIIARRTHARDLVQPGEYGFRTLYKEQWDAIGRANEKWEREAREEERYWNEKFKEGRHDIERRKAVKKAEEWSHKLSHGGNRG